MVMRIPLRKKDIRGDQQNRQDRIVEVLPNTRSLISDVVLDVAAVLRVAREIETNPNAMIFWYQHVKIIELGSLTAEQLVNDGRANEIVQFLRSVQSGMKH
jgi:hypothetical protein